jgi:hypothetical protein
MEPFYMVVAVKPKSLQGKGESLLRYVARLGEEAAKWHAGALSSPACLYARVLWVHTYPHRNASTCPDVDNIVKPVLDALKGLVYRDDCQVLRVTSTRWDASSVDAIGPQAALTGPAYDVLASLLWHRAPDILYVEVGTTDPEPVVFGPVDGV